MSGLRNDCFALPPGVHWTPVEDALAHLQAAMVPVTAEEAVALDQTTGRVLARDVMARRDSPPTANAAVDGYGFAHGTGEALPLVNGRSAAGAPFAGTVPPGHALRILTGAAIPVGVDTIVLQEDIDATDGVVRFGRGLKRGANIRKAGEDSKAGTAVLRAGRILGPQDCALIASVGHGIVTVRKRLRVAVMSTGDEVLPPGAPAADHRIHDANRPMLAALLKRLGAEVVDLGIIADRATAVEAAFDGAKADAIIASGGASGGDEDHVSAVLRARGAMDLWRIAVKPGRPLALGMLDGRPVFGLPGNPVAAFVCFVVFLRPALLKLAGAGWVEPIAFPVPAAFDHAKKPGRSEYLRARMTAQGQVEKFASEGSGRVSGLSWSEGLVRLAHHRGPVRIGETVDFMPYASLGA